MSVNERSPALVALCGGELDSGAPRIYRMTSLAFPASAVRGARLRVQTHVARILMKLDLRDRVQAIVFGYLIP